MNRYFQSAQRRGRWRFGLLVAAFLAGAISVAAVERGEPIELLLPLEPGFRYAGYYAAAWRGYFEDEGLTVHLQPLRGQDSPLEHVLQRPSVYGVGASEFLLARLQGRPVVMVAAVLQETPQALAVPAERANIEPEDLRGGRVALLPGVESAPLQLMLRRAGAGLKDAEWLAPWDGTAGRAHGGFDAWQVDVQTNGAKLLRPADHGVMMFYGDGLFTTEAELAYHPERVAAVRRAVLRGWDRALADAPRMIAEMEARRAELGLRPSREQLLYEAAIVRWLVKPSIVPLGTVEPGRVTEMAAALVALGLAPRVDYLENFVYRPRPPWFPGWIYWLGGALAFAMAGGLVMLAFNVRLQRRVFERTRELRLSEERAREMFEHAPVAIVEEDFCAVCSWIEEWRAEGVADLETWLAEHPGMVLELFRRVRPVQANVVALRTVGVRSLAAYAKCLAEENDPGVLEAFRQELLALWRGERELNVDVRFKRRDGGEGHGLLQWMVPNLDGRPDFARVLVVMTDVTALRRAEARLWESQQVLAAERERLAVTLRAMTEGVITTDREGVVQFINEAAEHLTGWADGAAIGRRLVDVCLLRHERSGVPLRVPFKEAMEAEAVMDLPRSTQLLDRQGVPRLVEGRCAPVHDTESHATGVVLVLRDAAERARLEAEMVRSSKLDSLGVLAGGIAHDFNNLLTVILGNVTLAQLDRGALHAAGQWLKEAEQAAVRARDLTRQLLTFAKGGDPVRTTVDLADVVKEAADFALHGSKARCDFTITPEVWPADVDKGQIGQVVQNLVINAIQAMPEGGLIRIKLMNESSDGDPVRAIAAGPYLRLEIADEGAGIPPENLGRIFDPYFTTKKTGSGLGLAMVYSIVRKHDGHIEVDSEVGGGTTFKIRLPARPAARPLAAAPEGELPRLSGRVLFMDDEELIRVMATTLLERLGLDVVAVGDGAAVLDQYAAARQTGSPYDVVLMDLTVPGGMGGREAMEALREIDPNVRAIVSSGYSSDPVLANYRAHGFRGRVAKPYRVADLAKTLRDVLAEEMEVAGSE